MSRQINLTVRSLLPLTAALAAGTPGALYAAEPAASVDEVVVTATRRNTTLDETPLSVSVVSSDALERDNVESIIDLNGKLPGLLVGQSFGGSRIAIRGVGFNPIRPGDEGRVAFYTDGVYVARPSAQIGSLFDVDRIEVLRGPQGTLYGRNATGGALLLHTREPTKELSGYLNAEVGDYSLRQFTGAISGPLTDTLSGRIAFKTTQRDGYWNNTVTGNEVGDVDAYSYRATLLWQPSEEFDLRATFESHREDDGNYVVHAIRPGYITDPYRTLTGTQDVAQLYDPINDVETYGGSLAANWRLNDQLTLSAVAGAWHVDTDLFVVGTATRDFSAASAFRDDSESTAVELQLAGDFERFDWIVGLSYFREDQWPSLRSAILGRAFFAGAPNIPVQGTNSIANLLTTSSAIFGEVTYKATDKLSLTAGVRYASETKKALNEYASLDLFTPWPAAGSTDHGFVLRPPRAGFPRNSVTDYGATTPKVSVNYQFTDDVSVYVTYVEGFKSGGFNYGTIQAPYTPEEITNVEAGMRANLFDRRLTVSGAVFNYDYTKLQQTVQLPGIVGTFVLNTDDATIRGAEIEFVARITDHFQIDGNASYLDTELDNFLVVDPNRVVNATNPALSSPAGITTNVVDIGGLKVPQAPESTVYLGAQYSWNIGAGSLTLRGDWRNTGVTYFDIFNNAPMREPSYSVLGANLTFESNDGKWRASLYGTNLDDTYAANSLALQANALGGGVSGNLVAPRTYGLSVGFTF